MNTTTITALLHLLAVVIEKQEHEPPSEVTYDFAARLVRYGSSIPDDLREAYGLELERDAIDHERRASESAALNNDFASLEKKRERQDAIASKAHAEAGDEFTGDGTGDDDFPFSGPS